MSVEGSIRVGTAHREHTDGTEARPASLCVRVHMCCVVLFRKSIGKHRKAQQNRGKHKKISQSIRTSKDFTFLYRCYIDYYLQSNAREIVILQDFPMLFCRVVVFYRTVLHRAVSYLMHVCVCIQTRVVRTKSS